MSYTIDICQILYIYEIVKRKKKLSKINKKGSPLKYGQCSLSNHFLKPFCKPSPIVNRMTNI